MRTLARFPVAKALMRFALSLAAAVRRLRVVLLRPTALWEAPKSLAVVPACPAYPGRSLPHRSVTSLVGGIKLFRGLAQDHPLRREVCSEFREAIR